MNVCLSRAGATRWALTERGSGAVARDAGSLAIGRSSMQWTPDGALAIEVDERTAPWGRPVRGRVHFHPTVRTEHAVPIDAAGHHWWWPIAPLGRVEVVLDGPRVRFSGTGYFDGNAGDGPLEETFSRWSWARMSEDESVAITYDVDLRRGGLGRHALHLDRGGLRELETGGGVGLGATRFGLPRSMRPPAEMSARLVRTVEDGPFYARSIVECHARHRRLRGVHETVSLDRFAASWVRFLIPFRMRRERPT